MPHCVVSSDAVNVLPASISVALLAADDTETDRQTNSKQVVVVVIFFIEKL